MSLEHILSASSSVYSIGGRPAVGRFGVGVGGHVVMISRFGSSHGERGRFCGETYLLHVHATLVWGQVAGKCLARWVYAGEHIGNVSKRYRSALLPF